MQSKSDNIEIMISDEVDEVIKELFTKKQVQCSNGPSVLRLTNQTSQK